MRRVASLFLPSVATDRLRRIDATTGRPPDRAAPAQTIAAEPVVDDEAFACSCPRGGGWRPGARWAQSDGAGAVMASRETRIAAMPAHQRPPIRELGRRSEAADPPFKSMRRSMDGPSGAIGTPTRGSHLSLPPLVTTAREGQKVVIAAADDGALALGLSPGMALTHARALVPGLDVRDGDPDADRALLDRLTLFAVRRWTPIAMADGDDGLLLDVTGVSHLHGGEALMARRIVRFCARLGFQARVAIAGTIGAAHAVARFGAQRVTVCPAGGELDAVSPLPVAALRLEPHQCDAARRLGLETVADLFAMPRGPLGKRLGTSVLKRLDQALGRSGEPFDGLVPFVTPQAELRFAEPIASAEAIETVIRDLLAAFVETLRERGLGARSVRLECDRVDGVSQRIDIGMARGTREPRHILRLLLMKIETIDPGFGIDAMRLVATRSEPLGAVAVEGDLGGERRPADPSLLIDQVVARLGERAIYRPSAVESDVPERSVGRVAALDAASDWPARWPRPIRVLPRPEPVDGVMALLPDQPPRRFRWRGTNHAVTCADGPERILGEWWLCAGEAHQVRDYYRVENTRGERFWLFRRGDGEFTNTGDLSWYMAGFFP